LDGSPFVPDFNDAKSYYGDGLRILGPDSKKRFKKITGNSIAMTKKENSQPSMTVYSPYPLQHSPMCRLNTYQNGGDWTWFGGRMVRALTENGMWAGFAEVSRY